MSQVAPLTGATRAIAPEPCVDCVFWQGLRGVTDARRKDRWSRETEERFGPWGRVLHEGSEFLGMMQYGPQGAFPRAQVLPAGPPGRDAALLTCVYLAGDDPAGTCERLLLEALADLKARNVAAAEAFALRYPDEVPAADRFLGHHTLFDRTLLARFGFSPVRGAGQVALMRLAIGGLAPGRVAGARAALARLRPAEAGPAPRPA
jgi:hypothetical protein